MWKTAKVCTPNDAREAPYPQRLTQHAPLNTSHFSGLSAHWLLSLAHFSYLIISLVMKWKLVCFGFIFNFWNRPTQLFSMSYDFYQCFPVVCLALCLLWQGVRDQIIRTGWLKLRWLRSCLWTPQGSHQAKSIITYLLALNLAKKQTSKKTHFIGNNMPL